MLDGENQISNIWCLILMCSPCLPWFGSELLAEVTKWRQNAVCRATWWDSDCWSCYNTEKNPKLVNRTLSVTPGLALLLYVFYQSSSAPSRPPASSSIINHRSSRYITTIYHNHVCHYNRHLIVSTLGLYAPGSAFRFQAHSPSLQQVCGQDSPRFVEADAFLFCCVKNMNISIVQL